MISGMLNWAFMVGIFQVGKLKKWKILSDADLKLIDFFLKKK